MSLITEISGCLSSDRVKFACTENSTDWQQALTEQLVSHAVSEISDALKEYVRKTTWKLEERMTEVRLITMSLLLPCAP